MDQQRGQNQLAFVLLVASGTPPPAGGDTPQMMSMGMGT